MRLLIIAYHFPLDGAVGALRPYYFARHLREMGVDVWVLTVEPEFAERYDPSMQMEGVPAERIVRTTVLPSRRDRYLMLKERLSRLMKGRTTQHDERPVSQAVVQASAPGDKPLWRRWIAAWLSYPDWYSGWYAPAVEAGRRIIRENRIEAIFSTSPPRTVHLIARRLASEFHLRWVMDLRDPWTVAWQGSSVALFPFAKGYERLLTSCMSVADSITWNTNVACRCYASRYSVHASKMHTLPNGIGDSLLKMSADYCPSSTLLIGHFGSLYGKRNLDVLLTGLHAWFTLNPESRRRIRVGLWGQIDNFDLSAQLERLALADVVHFEGVVPRSQVLEQMGRCYALLVVATDQPLQIPAKVYEYIAMRRRIVVLTEPDSATAELLRGQPYCYLVSNPSEAQAALESIWQDFISGASAVVDRSALIEQYSYATLTRRLLHLLRGD